MAENKIFILKQELSGLRRDYQQGDNLCQAEIDHQVQRWAPYRDLLRPGEKDEIFRIVDKQGTAGKLTAPRWFCHLLGLRHKTVHILLSWQSPGLGTVFVLQMRSWQKENYPGHLDISVGGHMAGESAAAAPVTAYREMEEELGLKPDDLTDSALVYRAEYENQAQLHIKENNYDAEWRVVFSGRLKPGALEKIRFPDREVAGLYLCPVDEAAGLLQQTSLPLANGLRETLPRLL